MFTPIPSLIGGVLIGLAAAALLLGHGRVAGISGVLGGTLRPRTGEMAWRLWFLFGLIGGGTVIAWLRPASFPVVSQASAPLLILAGLFVGFGTRLGGGCTSGHGVCGIGRFSSRSVIATVIFMATGAGTVFLARHVLGGAA
jgi:uncharacterized membrane protein YedE/YeeE